MRLLSSRILSPVTSRARVPANGNLAQGSDNRWAAILLVLALALGAFQCPAPAQLYRSSVTATDYDFILGSDPDAFLCLEFKGKRYREMPDKRGGRLHIQQALVFVAYFSDGTQVDIAIAKGFADEATARAEALRYTPRLGHLPTSLRRGVERLVVHKGGRDTTAFSDRGLIVVYSANATRRIATHDLEETIFHESVHASWDAKHANSPDWKQAQKDDGVFITRYAKNNPRGEDLAESALFAFTLVHHPGRLPVASADRIWAAIPTRIHFVKDLLPPDKPLTFQVAPAYACDGSGETFTVSESRFLAQKPPERSASRRKRENDPQEPFIGPNGCTVDLSSVPQMSDVLSNALMRGLDIPEEEVVAFLGENKERFVNADSFLRVAAKHFNLEPALLRGEIEAFRHCNCEHPLVEIEALSPASEILSNASAESSNNESGLALKGASSVPEATELKPLLYAAIGLLALLLIVNLFSLRLLMRQSQTKA